MTASDGSAVAIANRRARALLAILAIAPDQRMSRVQIARLLWPGRFEAQARASLRQCLLDLAKTLENAGIAPLEVTREHVALRRHALDFDLLEGHGTGALLEDFHFGDAFDSWLDARRRDLVAGLPAAAPIGGPVAMPRSNRIAVLPFQPVGNRSDADYFADGIVDELITTLGQVPDLLVAGRTSSFHFRDSALPTVEIAAALGVSHLVEGSVQRQGERIRIHAHLVSGANGFEIWGQRFDGSLDDVFALQERVAQAITTAIGREMGLSFEPPKIAGMTASKAAYDLFLQGRSLCAKRFGDGVLDTAVTLFEQALAIDPNFARCWEALAEAHQLVSVYTQCLDRNGAAAKMAECARRAIALSPNLGYAHSLLGIYELTRNDFLRATDLGYRAYELDPDDPAVLMRLGYFLMFIGRTRDATPYIEAAVDQDPVDGRKYAMLWGVQLCSGDLEAARSSAQRMVDLGMMSISLGVTSAALGDHDLAIEQYLLCQQLMNSMILPPVGIGVQTPEAMDAYWRIAAKGICSGREEDRQAYWQVLEMLYVALHDKSDPSLTGPAIFTGNADLYFRAIGHSITPANLMALVPLWTEVEPMCRIWKHPEFIPFAQRIGMAAAWDKYGWPDLLPPPSNRI